MTLDEAKSLAHFTAEEIESTGAKLADVKFPLFQRMDKFREDIKRSVHPLHNGITTGNHKSLEHPDGRACDFILSESDGPIDPYFVFKRLIDADFNRIGIYFNGQVYSFHAAYADRSGFWSGYKKGPGGPWTYGQLLLDLPQAVKNLR